MRSGMCLAVALGLAAASVAIVCPTAQATVVGQVVFSDTTYADADWTIVNSFAAGFVGQVATGGDPGSYRQTELFVGEDVPFVGQLNRNFVYDPSASGPVTGITYNFALETTNAEGAGYEPLLEQNGKLYIDFTTTGNASPNTWLTENRVLGLGDFGELTISPLNALIFNPASKPDFSTNGTTMEFGYEVTAGGGGFFTSVTGIDNDPITLTVTPKTTTPSVPEPSTWALLLIGFAGVGFASYLRSAKRAARSPHKQRSCY
jgi:hypothetical protein